LVVFLCPQDANTDQFKAAIITHSVSMMMTDNAKFTESLLANRDDGAECGRAQRLFILLA
jgi:hypothetical protein